MTEKNALAKLAEEIQEIVTSVYYGSGNCGVAEARKIAKAQRIVEELSNADLAYANDPVTNNCVELRLSAFKKCRAIAEEGKTDERK